MAVVLLAVPIASFLEKRDRPAPPVAEDESFVDDSMGQDMIADDAEVVVADAGFAEEPVMADDAFGAEEPVAFADDLGGDDLFAEPGKS